MNKTYEVIYCYFKEWYDILVKVTDPEYENELGNKYFLRQWSKL
jgi:hypothetical protein